MKKINSAKILSSKKLVINNFNDSALSKETMTKSTSKNMFGTTTMSGFNATNKSFGETNPLNDKLEKEMS